MHARLLPVMLLATLACRTPSAGAPATAARWRGVSHQYNAHCGGAMLTRAQEAALTRPLPGVEFVVLRGEHNTAAAPEARFTTAKDGAFELPALAPGTYCVVRAANQISAEEERRLLALPPAPPPPEPKPYETVVDPACLERLPLRCDATWKVRDPGFDPEVDVPGTVCPWNRPCTLYRGPLPP